MSEHPTAAELEGLVRGDLTRDQARPVVRHLLRGCESCVAFIAPYASMLLDGSDRAGRFQPARVSTPAAPAGSPAAADAASGRVSRRGRPGRAAAAATAAPEAQLA